MDKLLLLILLLMICLQVNSQTQCFNQSQSTNTSAGPLKLSITDIIVNFQSGSYFLLNQNKNSTRYHCFNITFTNIDPNSQYETVASIQEIQDYQDPYGLDFSVRLTPYPTHVQGLFIISTTAVWTSVQLHYLISARDDFRLGSFVPQVGSLSPCSVTSDIIVISQKLIKPWNASKNLIFGLPFLSGIRTMDTKFSVIFNQSTFDSNASLISIPATFEQVQYPIEYFLVSYLLVTMDSIFQITNIYNLSYIPSDLNSFVGMTGINLTSSQSSVQGALMSSNVINPNKFLQFFDVQGIVIQSDASLDLLFSDGNIQTQGVIQCISAQKCSGYDGFMQYEQNQKGLVFHSQCILCGQCSSYNNDTQQCQCWQSYVKYNGSCVLQSQVCPKQNYFFNTTSQLCQCSAGYSQTNGSCIQLNACPDGYTSFQGNCYKFVWNTLGSITNNSNTTTNSSKNLTSEAPNNQSISSLNGTSILNAPSLSSSNSSNSSTPANISQLQGNQTNKTQISVSTTSNNSGKDSILLGTITLN